MTHNTRDQILAQLRAAQQPFTDVPPFENPRAVVPITDHSPTALLALFVQEAEKLGCMVYQQPEAQSVAQILALIGDDKTILSWDFKHIPLPSLPQALTARGVTVAPNPTQDGVRVGITGVDALLAGTGSLVVCSRAGKPRATSLLPDVHIAVAQESQLVADFETWTAQQKLSSQSAYRAPANTVVISGPSKTADIAQELIKGAHGPRAVHVFIVG